MNLAHLPAGRPWTRELARFFLHLALDGNIVSNMPNVVLDQCATLGPGGKRGCGLHPSCIYIHPSWADAIRWDQTARWLALPNRMAYGGRADPIFTVAEARALLKVFWTAPAVTTDLSLAAEHLDFLESRAAPKPDPLPSARQLGLYATDAKGNPVEIGTAGQARMFDPAQYPGASRKLAEAPAAETDDDKRQLRF